MASIFLRRNQWWIKIRHPGTGELMRESLQTHDQARAKILCEYLEHRAAPSGDPDAVEQGTRRPEIA